MGRMALQKPPAEGRSRGGAGKSAGLWVRISQAAVLRGVGMATLFLFHFVLARILLPEGYGTFSFTIATVGLLATIVSLGWPVVLQRFVAEYSANGEWGLLNGVVRRAHHVVLLTSAIGAVGLVAAGWVDARPAMKSALFFSAILLPLAGLVKIRRNAMQGLENVPGTVVPEEIVLPGMVIAGALLFRLDSPSEALLLYTASSISAFLLGSWWLHRSLGPQARAAEPVYRTRSWMRIAVAMLSVDLSSRALGRTDVLMLGIFGTMHDVGTYSVANRIAMLVPFAMQAANMVAAPRLAQAHAQWRPADFRSVLRNATIASGVGAFPIFLACMIAATPILNVFGQEYVNGAGLLRILAVGQFINAASGAVGYGLIMSGSERTYAKIVAVSAVANIMGNAVAVPLWGATGAAVMTAISVAGLNLSAFWVLHSARRRS